MSLNILIVEDEAITALDIKKKLEYWGYNVPKIAHTGLDAIEYAKNTNLDIILMDIILKGKLDGIETAEKIRNSFDIPIIYLTAHSEEKIMQRAKHTHPYGYLIKPLDEKELHFALDSAIYKHQIDRKLKKTNRALRMISDCNQAIVRIKNTDTLLNKICNLIVEEGGYELAWVGTVQDDKFKSIHPTAQYGFDDSYLEKLKISWGDNKYGQGPTGKAIRSGRISISRNLMHDPDFKPWREPALERGYHSSVALPLFIGKEVIGSLNIYSAEEDAFDSDELDLLNELSGDISFFLESQKLRERHEKAVKSLKISKNRLKSIVNSAPFGAHVYKLKNNDKLIFKGYNSSANKVLGVNHNQFIDKPIEEAFPGLIGSDLPEIYRKTASKCENYQEEKVEYYDEKIKGRFDITVVNTGKNEVTVFFRDITEKKKMEDAIRESEEKYRTIVEAANEGIWSMDKNFITTFVNQQMADMLGYEIEEIMGKNITFFMFEEEWPQHNELMKNRIKGLSDKYMRKFRRKDGSEIWSIVSATPLKNKNGEFDGSFAMLTDITPQKEYEEKIKTALKEKELLLSEIHHRVKNNMQIISSLLNLQNSYLNDEKDLELFIESQNRVKSMALIHEKLYRSKDLVEIDFAEYIRDLVYYLFYTYIDDPERIKIDFNTYPLNLNIETAIPCGIIINELVTNSIKHAFPENMSGKITTTLKKQNNEFILTIKDDGIGFPENIDFRNIDSLGLRLVSNLVDQIDGKINMTLNSGTEFKITFKELFYEKRV